MFAELIFKLIFIDTKIEHLFIYYFIGLDKNKTIDENAFLNLFMLNQIGPSFFLN